MAVQTPRWEERLYNFVFQSYLGNIAAFATNNIPFNNLQRRAVNAIMNHTNGVPQRTNQPITNRVRHVPPEQNLTYTDPGVNFQISKKVVASALIIGPPGTGKTHTICAGSILREFNPNNLQRVSPECLFIATFSNAGAYRIFEKFHEIAELANVREYYDRIKLVQSENARESYAFEMLRNSIGLNPASFTLTNRMPNDGTIRRENWRAYLRDIMIFVGTTDSLSILGTDLNSGIHVHSVIYDEASQITVPQFFQIIPQQAIQSVTVVGDDCQLPPITTLVPLGVGIISYLQGTNAYQNIPIPQDRRIELQEQYRMHPAIAQLTENILNSPRTVIPAGDATRQDYFLPRSSYDISKLPSQLTQPTLDKFTEILLPEHSLIIVDTSNIPQATDTQVGRSRLNEVEGLIGIAIYNALRLVYQNLNPNDIILTAPYARQVDLFRQHRVRTGTVHQYQGQEAEIVIYSLTFARPGRRSEFFSQVELMYVGLSRAKRKLIILGNQSALNDPDPAMQAVRNTIFRYQYVSGRPGYPHYPIPPVSHVQVDQQFLSDINNYII